MNYRAAKLLSTYLRTTLPILTVVLLSFLAPPSKSLEVSAQRRVTPKKAGQQSPKTNQLAKLREEFVEATKTYKASLEKLRALYDKNVTSAESRLAQSQKLYAEGLISRKELDESEHTLAESKDKVAQAQQQLETAETQIANTLIEARAEAKMSALAKTRRGALVTTTSYIRYNGTASWALSDAWKVQRFYLDTFQRPLPIGVFGQGAIHDRWRFDHRNAMDVSVHPDGAEGKALINFLRANGIPFLAFREAIPGTATGPHIHVGKPSHRY
ncbi:MAG: TolC family protein [Pyrinomonadaceae bacterium]